jgi:hypothetical protein
LHTPEEKDALTSFDVLVFNLKKLLAKLPFGRTLIASYAAALYLLHEQKYAYLNDDQDMLYEDFMDFYDRLYFVMRKDQQRAKLLTEELQKKFSVEDAKEIGSLLDVDWDEIDIDQFRKGLEVETEHADVVGDNLKTLGKIALAHLDEIPDYYDRLEKMEKEAKAVNEEPPANNVGSGNIAGLGPHDVVVPMPVPMLKRKKKIGTAVKEAKKVQDYL